MSAMRRTVNRVCTGIRFLSELCKPEPVIGAHDIKSPPNAKVCVVGNSPLTASLMLHLKRSCLIDELRLFDSKQAAKRITDDLSLIDTVTQVKPYYGHCQLGVALADVDVIVLAGGDYGRPGECKSAVFKRNAAALVDCAYDCAHHNPHATLVVLTPPGTRNVPLVSMLYEKLGIEDKGQIMSPMGQHEMSAATLVAEMLHLPAGCARVPVVGGCCSDTVVPVLSQASPQNEFSERDWELIVDALRMASQRVAVGQGGRPQALAPALAAAELVLDLVSARFSISRPPRSVFLKSQVLPSIKYLGMPVQFGPEGVKSKASLPPLTDQEMALLLKATVSLKEDAKQAKAVACAEWSNID
ncbi:malate dehydrogenase, mitochondrial-like isoform X2 [Nilaparvata lugens]|nr:malate dehydrogenase, mitochondrial-like isoform X2 [Nilaparvata lugens]